ncbi:hypothetical protein [Paenibacillus sp. J2TS4]|uniref:hypothetical protein n=1 Tax=Paenibacillus sp. J2TS4 TaxID=2807194 RepID=UPI001B1A7965|nr:hypothetical protein [Paenibacillus sp. J2TS4]GIP36576.1 hypothetical protein J2TS4_57860 [Paenibacillus sp. J2TS4]
MSAPTQTKPMAASGDDFSVKAILPPLMAIIVAMSMVILDRHRLYAGLIRCSQLI